MSNALWDLLALVNLGDFLFQKLVAALTELDNAGVSGDPSWKPSVRYLVSPREQSTSLGEDIPETSLRTFCEISAATLYLVIVSGFARE